jgi:hypothetical protein
VSAVEFVAKVVKEHGLAPTVALQVYGRCQRARRLPPARREAALLRILRFIARAGRVSS